MKRDLFTFLTSVLLLGCDPDVIDHEADTGGNDDGGDPEGHRQHDADLDTHRPGFCGLAVAGAHPATVAAWRSRPGHRR